MFTRFNSKELQNLPPRSPALKLSDALSSRLRLDLQPPKSKKEPQSSLLSQNNVGLEMAQHFPRAKTPYSASFPVPEGAGCWSRRSTLVGLAAPNPQKLSTAQRSYPQKIYENSAFP
jgi:hypothetical protein